MKVKLEPWIDHCFEVWTVLVSELSDKEKKKFYFQKRYFKEDIVNYWEQMSFNDAVSKGVMIEKQ